MSTQYTIGLDYGTNSVRALIVNVTNGTEVAAAVERGRQRARSEAKGSKKDG